MGHNLTHLELVLVGLFVAQAVSVPDKEFVFISACHSLYTVYIVYKLFLFLSLLGTWKHLHYNKYINK